MENKKQKIENFFLGYCGANFLSFIRRNDKLLTNFTNKQFLNDI